MADPTQSSSPGLYSLPVMQLWFFTQFAVIDGDTDFTNNQITFINARLNELGYTTATGAVVGKRPTTTVVADWRAQVFEPASPSGLGLKFVD